MKIQPYVTKLSSSGAYHDFQKKYSNSFMVAGFFVLDLETGNNLHQIDYYVPSEKKIAAFTLDKRVTVQLLDMIGKKAPEKLDINTKIDLDQLKGILDDEMKNRNITDQIKKIIAILQNIDGKKIWNLNCVLSGLGILTAHVEDSSGTVIKMEKKSLVDYMQKIPGKASAPQKSESVKDPAKAAKINKDVKEQLKKLQDIQEELEKEKAELQKASQDEEKD